jgi:hypothetical protein
MTLDNIDRASVYGNLASLAVTVDRLSGVLPLGQSPPIGPEKRPEKRPGKRPGKRPEKGPEKAPETHAAHNLLPWAFPFHRAQL